MLIRFITAFTRSFVTVTVGMILGVVIIGGIAAFFVVAGAPSLFGFVFLGFGGLALIKLWTVIGLWIGWAVSTFFELFRTSKNVNEEIIDSIYANVYKSKR